MGFFIKNTVLGLLVVGVALAQPNQKSAPQDVLIDGYYPPYPPVTLSKDSAQNTQIQRGEYLAKMGDCIACHTNVRQGTPAFTGGLPLKTPFGTFYTPNITPDKQTGIGQWTEQDFVRSMRHGRNPAGRNYFPVFPYVYFSKMTDEDLKALYAYFMSIPPVHRENRSQPFPFNLPGARFALWGWKLLFFYPDEGPIPYDPGQSEAWNRGRYIVDGAGHCSMCHTPLNPLGGAKKRYYLTGTFVDGYWAPNITRYGLKSASHQEVADVFSSGQLINKAGPVAGPMAEVNHNSLQYLTDDDRLAIATYLKTVISEESLGVTPSSLPPSLSRGKTVYLRACDVCHQAGMMSAPRIGDGSNWTHRLQQSGLTGLYRHTINGYNSMPVKGACVTCSDNDLISAVDYLLNHSLSHSQWKDVEQSGLKKYPSSGRQVYDDNCAVCHNDGKEGAPKLGDKAVWDKLATQNVDVLLQQTLHGKRHAANGGCEQCTAGEVLEAIKYMLSQSTTEGNYSLW